MTNAAGSGMPRARRSGIYLVAGILLVLVITLAIALVVALIRPGGDTLTGANSTPTAGVSNGPGSSVAAPTAGSPAPGESTASSPDATAPGATATPAEATATPAPTGNHTPAPTAHATGTPKPTAGSTPVATPKPAITAFSAPGTASCAAGTVHLSWNATNTTGVILSIDPGQPYSNAWTKGFDTYPAVGSADVPFACPPPDGPYHVYVITTIHSSGSYYTYRYVTVYSVP